MQSEKDSHIQYLEAQVRRLQDKLGQCAVCVYVYVCMYYVHVCQQKSEVMHEYWSSQLSHHGSSAG